MKVRPLLAAVLIVFGCAEASETSIPVQGRDLVAGGDLPPIEGLSAEDVEAVVAFVREQQRIRAFEPYPP